MEDNSIIGSSASTGRSLLLSNSIVVAAVLLVTCEPAIAQETRAESIREQQAEKRRVAIRLEAGKELQNEKAMGA